MSQCLSRYGLVPRYCGEFGARGDAGVQGPHPDFVWPSGRLWVLAHARPVAEPVNSTSVGHDDAPYAWRCASVRRELLHCITEL